MKLKHIYIYILLFIGLANKAQINLVPNPSFEDTIGDCQSQMIVSSLVSSVKNWHTCTSNTTPDYYNTCANAIIYPNICTVPYNTRSYQTSHTGNAYLGIGTYFALNSLDSSQVEVEYISVKLKQPLRANTCYYAEFYASLGNISKLAINQISLLLSQNTFTTATGSFTNTIQPQVQWDTTKYFTDTLNWVKIAGTFISQGGEQYLTIGNFKDGLHLKKKTVNSNFTPAFGTVSGTFFSYILIDDVSLYELPTPQLQSSYVICPTSDSLVIGDTARMQTRYQWYVNGVVKDTTSYIKIKPNQTTTYVLHTTNCSTSTQTVVVTYSNNCEPIVIIEPTIPNVFTPNGDGTNDVWSFDLGKGASLKNLSVYNRWGNSLTPDLSEGEGVVHSQNMVRWDGYSTSGIEFSSGVYFYTLQYTDANGDVHKKNGYVTLIR